MVGVWDKIKELVAEDTDPTVREALKSEARLELGAPNTGGKGSGAPVW